MDPAFLVIAYFPLIAACACLCAVVAKFKGRGMLPWGIAGYLLGPVGLVWVLALRRSNNRRIVDIRHVQLEYAVAEPVMLHPQAHGDRMKGQKAA
jgi:hypothetical protein